MKKVLSRYDSREDFEHTLLFYVQMKGIPGSNKAVVEIIDEKLNILRSNQEIEEAQKIALRVRKDDNTIFILPAFKRPKIGTLTFDQRFTRNDEGELLVKEQHIGNEVIQIVRQN